MVSDKKPYGKECDIWSVGVVLYAMVYGQLPFKGNDVKEIKDRVLKGKFILKRPVSQPCQNLIKSILTLDPYKRPTIDEMLQHEWLQDCQNEDDTYIFSKAEQLSMLREFFFLEKDDDWQQDIAKQINRDEHDEMFKFGLQNLNSTEDASDKNCSEISDILGPFNSTLSAKDDLQSDEQNEILDKNIPIVNQYEIINWKPKAKQANVLYLRNFNQSFDLGINLGVAQ